MRAAGCDIVVDAKDLSVVGITEILGHLPKIWQLFHKLIAEVDKRRPELAVVIDSPAFNWRVARQMKKRSIPVVYYVCPQFWAWRQGRVRLLRKYVDKALVIFPFEEKFYRDRGVNAEFVGHPLAELPRPSISRERYAAEHGLDLTKQWITLMPGSRAKEVRMNLPGIFEAAALLSSEYEFLIPVAPTLGSSFIQGMVDSDSVPAKQVRKRGPSKNVHLVPEALPALAHSRAGIIASGTATVEAAMMETPFVMVYRVTPLTYLLGRWTVKVPHFAMVNLIAGEEVVPELVQQDFTPERVAAELKRIIPDGSPREKMIDGLRRVKRLLRGDVEGNAPEHAARAIAQVLARRT
jgi:lipid-A-disaccharide synthase